MYVSLMDWMVFDFIIHKRTGKTIAGDAIYADPMICKGYRVDNAEQIIDMNNHETVSMQRIYYDNNIALGMYDLISFPEAPDIRLSIKKIGAYFDGNEAIKSISIAYL